MRHYVVRDNTGAIHKVNINFVLKIDGNWVKFIGTSKLPEQAMDIFFKPTYVMRVNE